MSENVYRMGEHRLSRGEVTHNHDTRYMNILHAYDHSVHFRRFPITNLLVNEPHRIRTVLEEMGVIQEGLNVVPVPEEDFYMLLEKETGLIAYYILPAK